MLKPNSSLLRKPSIVFLLVLTLGMVSSVNALDENSAAAKLAERYLSVLKRSPKEGTAFDKVYEFFESQDSLDRFAIRLQSESEDDSTGGSDFVLGLLEMRRGRPVDAREAFLKANEKRVDDAVLAMYTGRVGEALKDDALAANSYENALSWGLPPAYSERIYPRLGRLYQSMGNTEKSVDVWKRFGDSFPDDADVGKQIAEALAECGLYGEALLRYDQLRNSTNDPEERIQLLLSTASLKQKLNRSQDAKSDLMIAMDSVNPTSWLYEEIQSRVEELYFDSDDVAGLIAFYTSRLENNAQDIPTVRRLASILIEEQQPQKAAALLQSATSLAPSDLELRMQLVDTLEKTQRFDEAIRECEHAHEIAPRDIDVIERWGLLCTRHPDWDPQQRRSEAVRAWKKITLTNVDDSSLLIRVADLLKGAELPDAEGFYRRAVAAAPQDVDRLEFLGAYLFSTGRSEEAVAVWNRIAAVDMPTAEQLRRLSTIFRSYGMPTLQRETLLRLWKVQPKFSDLLQLSQSLRNAGEFTTATKVVENARHLADSDIERRAVMTEWVNIARESNEVSQLIADLNASLASKPNVDDWIKLALLLNESRRSSEAITAVNAATKLDPSAALHQTIAAELQENAGRWELAIETRTALAKLQPRLASDHLRKVIELHRRLGQFDQALQTGRTLIALAPLNVDNYQFVSDMCLDLGEYDRAQSILKQSVAANPGSVAALESYAKSLGDRFRTQEAISTYWTALESTTDTERQQSMVVALSSLATRSGTYDRFRQRLKRWVSGLSPQSAAMLRATAEQVSGNLTDARRILESQIRRSPRDIKLLTAVVHIAEAEKDYETAVLYQQRLLAVSRSEDAESRLGNLVIRAAESSPGFNNWLRDSDVVLPIPVALQQVDRLVQEQRFDSASLLCERLLRTQGMNWEALYRLAFIQAKKGRKDLSRQLCQQILSLPSESESPARLAARNASPTGLELLATIESDRTKNAVQRRLEWLQQLRVDGWTGQQLDDGMPAVATFAACRLRTCLLWWSLADSKREGREVADKLRARAATQKSTQSRWEWWLVARAQANRDATNGALLEFVTSTDKLLWNKDIPESQLALLEAIASRTQLRATNALPPEHITHMLEATVNIAPLLPVGDLNTETITEELARTTDIPQRDAFYDRVFAADSPTALQETGLRIIKGQEPATLIARLEMLAETYDRSPSPPPKLSVLRNPGELLYGAVSQAVAREDWPGTQDILNAYFRLRTHRAVLKGTDSELPSDNTTLFERRNIVIRSQPGLFQQRRIVGVGELLDRHDHMFLVNVATLLKEKNGSLLSGTLEQNAATAIGAQQMLLDLMAAELHSLNGDTRSAVARIVRAAAAQPTNVVLRVGLAEWYGQLGNYGDALAILDSIPPDQQRLLQERETLALEYAGQTGQRPRLMKAARRLFGLRLSGREANDLSRRMRELGLIEEAEALKGRQRSGKRDTLRDKVALMENEDPEIAVEIAVEILRQTESNTVSWTSDISSDKARAAAVRVLGQAGRLGELIATAEERLASASDSISLNEQLLGYYEASGNDEKAAGIRERLRILAPETVDSIMQSAADFERRKENTRAAARYLQVFELDPLRFAQDYFRYLRLFEDADRLHDLADLMLRPETLKRLQNHHHVVMETVQFLFATSNRSRQELTRQKGLLLFRAAWQQFPNYRRSIVSNIHTDAMWELPELVKYARDGLIPQSMQQAIARPWQGLAEKLDFDRHKNIRGTMTRIRSSLRQDPKLQAEYLSQVESAVARYEHWYGGRVLLAVLLLDTKRNAESAAQIESIATEENAFFMPLNVAWLLAQEAVRSDAQELEPITLALLHRMVDMPRSNSSDLDESPHAWLARYYQQRDRNLEAVDAVTNALLKTESKSGVPKANANLAAANLLRELGYPFHAYGLAEQIDDRWFADPGDTKTRAILKKVQSVTGETRPLTGVAAAQYLRLTAAADRCDLFTYVVRSGPNRGRLRSRLLDAYLADRRRPGLAAAQLQLDNDEQAEQMATANVCVAAIVIGDRTGDESLFDAGLLRLERHLDMQTPVDVDAWLAVPALKMRTNSHQLGVRLENAVFRQLASADRWTQAAILSEAASLSATENQLEASAESWNAALDVLLSANGDREPQSPSTQNNDDDDLIEMRNLLLKSPPVSQ